MTTTNVKIDFTKLNTATTNSTEFIFNQSQVRLDQDEYERQLKERQNQHLDSIQNKRYWQPCLHDQCQDCHGTGISRFGGACIHAISCPCSKCTPTY